MKKTWRKGQGKNQHSPPSSPRYRDEAQLKLSITVIMLTKQRSLQQISLCPETPLFIIITVTGPRAIYFVHSYHFLLSLCLQGNRTLFTLFILTTSYCHYANKATEHCLLCSFLPLPTVIMLTKQLNTVYFVHSDHFLLSLC